MVSAYIPEQGHAIWVNFNPALGHEQKHYRPALVLSPKNYNQKTGLLVCCPITSKSKGYPFEVKVVVEEKLGVILSDQIHTIDWGQRNVRFIKEVPVSVLQEVQEKIRALVCS